MTTTRRDFITGAVAGTGAAVLSGSPVGARDLGLNRVVFEDGFDRSPEWGWGEPWYNQRYRRHWRIENGTAIFRLPPSANRRAGYAPDPVLVLDRDVADIDLRVVVSSTNTSALMGALARMTGYFDAYAACLGPGQALRLARFTRHEERVFGSAPIALSTNRRYVIRLQVKGDGPVTLRAKAWPAGRREPAGWMVEAIDASPYALMERGSFGVVAQHALDGRGSTVRLAQVTARSNERPRTTKPRITYSLIGLPDVDQKRMRALAKSDVPASIGFRFGTEPTLTQKVLKTAYKGAGDQPHTAKHSLSLSRFEPGTIVYWRAVAVRKGIRSEGPIGSFKVPEVAGQPIRFIFGSCTRWEQAPHHSFERARLRAPDFYVHQGDLGYAMNRVVVHSRDAYQDHWVRELADPDVAAMCGAAPMGLQRDDAEYGMNAADRRTLRRFTIGAHNALNANAHGDYHESRFGDVAIFMIDCRRYSTGKEMKPRNRSKLGVKQTRWLKRRMRAAAKDPKVSLLIVASTQSFGSDVNPASWRRGYPAEWGKLIDFFVTLSAPVLVISGDAHGHRLHEYPHKDLPTDIPRIVEFTSSGTEQNKFFDSLDPEVLLHEARGSGFGLVEIGPEYDAGGQRVRNLTLTPLRTEDGAPFWEASYLIVRGVGIFPLG